MQDVYLGVSLGSTPVERKGKKQNWSAGEAELCCSLSRDLSQSTGSSDPGIALQSCSKLGWGAGTLYPHTRQSSAFFSQSNPLGD